MDHSALTDARDMYQEKLVEIMTPHMLRTFQNMWTDARCKARPFQQTLQQVRLWNAEKIQQQTNTILLATPYLDNVIAAVFLSVVKVLSHVRLPNSRTDIRVRVPGKTVFVHTAFTNAAREFYELLAEGHRVFGQGRSQVQKEVARGAVRRAVQQLLPLKELLDAYISDEVDDNGMVSPEPMLGATTALPPESLLPRSIVEEPPAVDDSPEREPTPPVEDTTEDPPDDLEPPAETDQSRSWLDDGKSVASDEGVPPKQVDLSPRERPVMCGDAGDCHELDD